MRNEIIESFEEIISKIEGVVIPTLDENTILLETGLDSLGFAALVATLEEKTGIDPFSLSKEAYYPKTFGEFVAFYEKYQEK